MRGPVSTAARRTLGAWKGAPFGARVHTTLRWWSAPMEPLESAVPRSGRILEVGCGHGLVSMLLGASSDEREVVGIDIDAAKIELARAVAAKEFGERAPSFEHRLAGDVPTVDGGWDAIVIVDVLYLIGPAQRRDLLAECVDALAPGGELVVKEVDTRPRFKALLAQFQEFLSTRVLRITHGDDIDFPSAVELELLLDELGLRTTARRLDHGYFHPHCLVTGIRVGQNSVSGPSPEPSPN